MNRWPRAATTIRSPCCRLLLPRECGAGRISDSTVPARRRRPSIPVGYGPPFEDLLARGYGALLLLRYTDGIPLWSMTGSPWQDRLEAYHAALKHHLHRFGRPYAVLAMLLISGSSLPLAFGLLFFVLYCGYVSLQCEFRHAFHLSFVPLWTIGFCFIV